MMTASAVLDVVSALEGARIQCWVDGGWGVDALLGHQRRRHMDLDLIITCKDTQRAIDALGALGLAVAADERPTRIELQAGDQRTVDLHLIEFDKGGNGVQRLPDGSEFAYRAEGFNGRGRIGGRQVACISADVQVDCHMGYEPSEKDRADVAALARRYRLPVPLAYGDHRARRSGR